METSEPAVQLVHVVLQDFEDVAIRRRGGGSAGVAASGHTCDHDMQSHEIGEGSAERGPLLGGGEDGDEAMLVWRAGTWLGEAVEEHKEHCVRLRERAERSGEV